LVIHSVERDAPASGIGMQAIVAVRRLVMVIWLVTVCPTFVRLIPCDGGGTGKVPEIVPVV
jgi:hypothetical protein